MFSENEFIERLDKLPDSLLITQKQVELITNISASKLEKARLTGCLFSYVKIGNAVRYKLKDIRDFITQNTFSSTTEQQQHKANHD